MGCTFRLKLGLQEHSNQERDYWLEATSNRPPMDSLAQREISQATQSIASWLAHGVLALIKVNLWKCHHAEPSAKPEHSSAEPRLLSYYSWCFVTNYLLGDEGEQALDIGAEWDGKWR